MPKGFFTYKMDFHETFAPTTRSESIQIVLSIAGGNGFHLVRFDIKIAHLSAPIHENIFMDLPFGFEDELYRKFPHCIGMVRV